MPEMTELDTFAKLVEFAGWDMDSVGAVIATVGGDIEAEIVNASPEDLAELRDKVETFYKVLTNSHKVARELRESFNTLVKLCHETDILSKDDVDIVYSERNVSTDGAKRGRKEMTPAEKFAAAQKRLASKES